MGTITVNDANGVDYNAYIAALRELDGLTVAFTPIVHNGSPELGDDTITLDLGDGLSVVVFGEFSGNAVFDGSGPVYGFQVVDNGVVDVTATWADGRRFGLEDVRAAFLAGGDALENLITADPIVFRGNDGNDIMIAGDANDTLNGDDGNDNLTGGAGKDKFNGGAGADTMTGGDDNDVYVNPVFGVGGDTIIETATGGTDTVQSNATISIAGIDFIEKLTLIGGGHINGVGNAIANTITGNIGRNALDGGVGNDTIFGGDGNDTITGGDGADQMRGGMGNDTYINPILTGAGRDRIFEVAGEGTADLIQSNVSVNMNEAANVERLTLTGNGTANGIGNELANVITGNGGRNTLNGGGGNDTLDGGGGKDILIGGEGNDSLSGGTAADTFRFATANTGTDTINGFEVALDRFDLAGGEFLAVSEVNGNTRLTHAGGTIIVRGVDGLSRDQWNGLVLPAGGVASVHESLSLAADDSVPAGHLAHADYLLP